MSSSSPGPGVRGVFRSLVGLLEGPVPAVMAGAAIVASAQGQLCTPPPEYSSRVFPLIGSYGHTYYAGEYRDGRSTVEPNPDPLCNHVDPDEPWESWCWFNVGHPLPTTGLAGEPYLYKSSPWGLNLDLDVGVVAGDYAPLTRDVRASTSPLVPRDVPGNLASLGLPERQALENQVDLITGVPLLREVDLEIPFGTAVFRHIRTYSEPPPSGDLEYLHSGNIHSGMHLNRMYWDWCGQGWMMSENPILLLDANWWGISDPADGTNDQRIYFLPDAHQSIPFVFSDLDGTYVAPPRFDAVLSHDGEWAVDHWECVPNVFRVWLHGASVMYTFERQHGDVGYLRRLGGDPDPGTSVSRARVPSEDLVNSVNPPTGRLDGTTGGFGTPHWALCTRIEDRDGNAIRITHCDFTRTACDHEGTIGWEECCQSCRTKGQIAHIELCVPGEGAWAPEVVKWTLVYVHRTFDRFDKAEMSITPQPDGAALSAQTALVSLLAYPGEVAEELGAHPCPMIPASAFDGTQFPGMSFFEMFNAWWDVDGLDVLPSGPMQSDWTHHVKYLYLDNEFADVGQSFTGDLAYTAFRDVHNFTVGVLSSPTLILASRFEQRDEETAEEAVGVAHWAYRSRVEGGMLAFSHDLDAATSLQAAWGPRAMAALRMSVAGLYPLTDVTSTPSVSRQEWIDAWPLSHCFVDPKALVDVDVSSIDVTAPPSTRVQMLLTADTVMLGWRDSTGLDPEQSVALDMPVGRILDETPCIYSSDFLKEMIDDYVGLPLEELQTGFSPDQGPAVFQPGGVGLLVSGSSESARVYRVYRFLGHPHGFVEAGPGELRTLYTLQGDGEPMLRSIWHEPYNYFDNYAGPLSANTGDPYTPGTEILHVAVIDEYESLSDAAYQTGGAGDWDVTLDELPSEPEDDRRPLSRRVVRMNPAGYVLSEETWDFTTGITTASGLREHYEYEEIPALNPPSPAPANGSYPRNPGVRIKEYRTFSWDAARLDDSEETEGLTYVFAYDDSIDSNTRAGAIGVRRGSGPNQPIAWTNIWVRDPNRPDHVSFEIQVTGADPILPDEQDFWDPGEWDGYLTSGPSQSLAGIAVTWRGAMFGDENAGFGLFESDEQGAPLSSSQTPAVGNMALRLTEQYAVFPPSLKQDGEWYYPIEATKINYYGMGGADWGDEQWRGIGSTTTPPHPAAFQPSVEFELAVEGEHSELYIDFSRTYADGSRSLVAADVGNDPPEQPAFGNGAGQIPDPPSTWDRPLNQPAALLEWVVTSMGPYGVDDVVDHSGRRRATSRGGRYATWHADPTTWMGRTARFNDIEMRVNGTVETVHSAGEQVWELDGKVQRVEVVNWTISSSPEFLGTWTASAPLSVMVPAQDGSGRLVALQVNDAAGSAASVFASIKYDRYGEVTRERHPDGTIVRNVADYMGRLERVYRGSRDVHHYWGTAAPWTSTPQPTFVDDMVLVEKRYYGDGSTTGPLPDPLEINNTRRHVATRRYRDAAASVYHAQPGIPNVGEEDDHGWVERYEYDWRGRQAVVSRYGEGDGGALSSGPLLSETHTFYDNADRPILIATYGDNPPPFSVSALNPAALPTDCETPTAAELIAGAGSTYDLRRLSETVYNPRGLVEEQREYDISDSTGETYLATVTHYDHAGRPVHVRSSTGTIQTYVYDARGRQVRTVTGVDLDGATGEWDDVRELSVTETTYGNFANSEFFDRGKAITVVTRERLHDDDSTSLTLDESNSIASYSFNWYNLDGTLHATASLGTGGDTFANPTTPPERPAEGRPDWTLVASVPTFTNTSPDPLPAGARVTTYGYNEQGHQTRVVRPDGTCTTQEYNNLGQLLLVTENAWAPEAERAQTAYQYDDARLVKVAALADPSEYCATADLVPWTTANSGWQITEFDYGAPVVFAGSGGTGGPGSYAAVAPSQNHSSLLPINESLIGAIHFPDHATGLPRTTPDLRFAYYPDGLLAKRTDAIGTTFEHAYDELANRTLSHINTIGVTNAPHAYATSEDFIRDIEYQYDPATGDLLWAQATANNGTTQIVATHRFDYDQIGNLIREYQVHGGTITEPSVPNTNPAPIAQLPVVEYAWDYATAHAGGGNYNRLAGMSYPPRPNSNGIIPASSPPRRTLTLGYGATGVGASVADLINDRASRVSVIGDSVLGSRLAEFEYAGSMRRVGFHRGFIAGVAAFAVSQGFAASVPAEGYEGLDGFGRVAALRFEGPGSPPALQHEYSYAYDAVDNPIQREVVQRPYQSQSHDNQRSNLWSYDGLQRLVGTQTGALSNFGQSNASISASALLPSPRLEDWTLDPLGNHELREVTIPVSGGPQTTTFEQAVNSRNELTGLTTTIGTGSPSTDPCIYDLNGCLISDGDYFYQYDAWGRLSKVSNLGTAVLSSTGGLTSGSVGSWIVHYTYDALGRLGRLQRPLTGYAGYVHTEHYYYDGARRVQEVFRGVQAGGGSEENSESESTAPTLVTWTDREYIHTAGPGSYIDEYVCEVTNLATSQSPLFHLQDGNYTVVGLVNASGAVVRQHTFSPYGQLLYAEDLQAAAWSRIGHQGLFFDRLDAPQGYRDLSPMAVGQYQNRNRTYDPTVGRWLQRDPNGTGGLVNAMSAGGGERIALSLLPPDRSSVFLDGANGHVAYRNRPTSVTDSTGLFIGYIGTMSSSSIAGAIRDDQIDSGVKAFMSLNAMLQGAAFDTALLASWAEEWDQDDGFALEYQLARLAGPGAGGEPGVMDAEDPLQAIVIARRGFDDHHVIPRFLRGLDKTIGLNQAAHRAYHAMLRAAWNTAKLNAINSRGARRWRDRLGPEPEFPVSAQDMATIRRVLIQVADDFVAKFPGIADDLGHITREMIDDIGKAL